MSNKQSWPTTKAVKPSSVNAIAVPAFTADQPAVNEFCHILARILRRIASQSKQ